MERRRGIQTSLHGSSYIFLYIFASYDTSSLLTFSRNKSLKELSMFAVANSLANLLQLSFYSHLSTDTTLLKVANIYIPISRNQLLTPILLHLAAIDIVNHAIKVCVSFEFWDTPLLVFFLLHLLFLLNFLHKFVLSPRPILDDRKAQSLGLSSI